MSRRSANRYRPWILCFGVGLIVGVIGYLTRNQPGPAGEGPGFGTLPFLILLEPLLIGCIGAWYRNWRVTLLGTILMILAQWFAADLWDDGRISLNLDAMGILLLVCLAFAWATHYGGVAVVDDLRKRRLRKGLCSHCGYDLTGNTSGVCPECREPM